MFKRRKMSRRRSRKLFTKTAKRVNKRNAHSKQMRGGYRF